MSSKGRNSEKGPIAEIALRSILFAALILVLPGVTIASLFSGSSLLRAADYPLTPEEVSGVSLRELDGIRETSPDYSVSPNGTEIPKSEDDEWLPDLSLNAATITETAKNKRGNQPALSPSRPTRPQSPSSQSRQDRNPGGSENFGDGQSPRTKSIYSGNAAPTSDLPADAPLLAGRSDSQSVYFTGEAERSDRRTGASSLENHLTLSDVSRYEPGFSLSDSERETVRSGAITGSVPFSASIPAPPETNDSEFLTEPNLPVETGTQNSAPISEISPPKKPNRLDVINRGDLEFPTELDAPSSNGPTAGNADRSSVASPPEASLPSNPTAPSFPLESVPLDLKKDESDPENRIVADIKCSAGMEMSIARFNNLIKTKIGNQFSQQILEEDKRRLLQTKQYVDVTVSTSLVPGETDKVIVNFDFTPRRQMKYIKVIGNRKMSKTEILDELNMKRGESRMDPYDVENGRIRIAELYKSKNLNEPHVDILIGDRPSDVGVVYLINEGVKQRVRDTTFVGNSLVSSARLKSLISAKPGLLYFIGGEFSRERLDEDVTKLLEYYRNLGCFDAKVDREFEMGDRFQFFNQENEWVKVKYVIDEGPRYKIRRFLFEGNRVISSDELNSKLKVRPGSQYNHNDLEGDRIALKYAYGERGYVLADIKRTQIFTEEDGKIDIRYDIEEDYRYRVKDIQIRYEGEESRTKASVVMNMLDFAPGQILNDKKIKGSENSLKRSGYFNDKPSEGPLPTVSIIPEAENLYFAEESGNGTGSDRRRTEQTAGVSDFGSKPGLWKKSGKKGKESKSGAEGADEKDFDNGDFDNGTKDRKGIDQNVFGKKILGQTPDPDPSDIGDSDLGDRGVGDRGVRLDARGDHPVGRPNDSSVGAPIFDPGFRVSGDVLEDSSPRVKDGGTDEQGAKEQRPALGGSATIRGQTMEVPTGFGRTGTTRPTSGAWNGSDYVGYQGGTTGSTGSTGVNAYSDTSMYNNGSYALGGGALGGDALAVGAAAPPMTADASSSGIYSATTLGADPSKVEVPGFTAAGRDAVFPGSQEQQYLDNQLWGNAPYPGFGNEEPVRDATVVASVMEGRTGMFQASIGVNSNYGLVGNISFTERNFDILKWPTAFWRGDGWSDAFRGGGQIFRAEASPGKYYSRYSVSWDVPYIFNTNYNFGVTGLYADRYYDNWDDSRYGGELRFGRQWTPRFSTTGNVGAYNIKIHNPRVNYVPDINEVLGNNSQFLVGLNACYDTRNHPYLPSEGYVLDGSAEQIFGSYTYPRVSLDGRTYFTVHRRVDGSGRMVLGLRSAAGWTGKETPIYDRYFGGGYQNLRGFEYREVTPRYQNTNIGIGGHFEFYNSAELLVPVSGGDEFQLAFFLDTGIVSESINRWDTYRVAPGIGMRIAIPMLGPAPLALDFAFPVVQNDSDEKEIFSFSIQGSR